MLGVVTEGGRISTVGSHRVVFFLLFIFLFRGALY